MRQRRRFKLVSVSSRDSHSLLVRRAPSSKIVPSGRFTHSSHPLVLDRSAVVKDGAGHIAGAPLRSAMDEPRALRSRTIPPLRVADPFSVPFSLAARQTLFLNVTSHSVGLQLRGSREKVQRIYVINGLLLGCRKSSGQSTNTLEEER